MYFYHADHVWNQFPDLNALVILASNVRVSDFERVDIHKILNGVSQKLTKTPEGEFPSVQAWRRAYSDMGLKPTQYRCAVEALLRRYRKDAKMPCLLPLIDYLNAESMNAGIPIAVFDLDKIEGGICVRCANGAERHHTFKGEVEYPAEGEIIFADEANVAHSRRWVFRQSAQSVVSSETDKILIVAEALHQDAASDLSVLRSRLLEVFNVLAIDTLETELLSKSTKRFETKTLV